jgi:hypothetical protein
MTKQELNRDIRRLKKVFNDMEPKDETDIQREFNRLYWADKKFEYMTRANILFMFAINRRYQFLPSHKFGLYIEL